jgi:hypothetical protein
VALDNPAQDDFDPADADLDTTTTRTPKLSKAQAQLADSARQAAQSHEKNCTCTQCKGAKR